MCCYLLPLGQKEKSKRLLSSSLYVSKKLLTASVTGPQFVSREGKLFSHRRRLRNDTHVAEADELPMGFYKVDRLLEYLPPWEAFVHPKCGLYQAIFTSIWVQKVHFYAFFHHFSVV